MNLKFIELYNRDTLSTPDEPQNVPKHMRISRRANSICINRVAAKYMEMVTRLDPDVVYKVDFSFVNDETDNDEKFVIIIRPPDYKPGYIIRFIQRNVLTFASKPLVNQFYKEFSPNSNANLKFLVGDKIIIEGFTCYELKLIKDE